jgi:hypothetical protein
VAPAPTSTSIVAIGLWAISHLGRRPFPWLIISKLPRWFATTGPVPTGTRQKVRLSLPASWYKYNLQTGIHKCFQDGGATSDARKTSVENYLRGMLTEVKAILGKQGVTGVGLKAVPFFFYATGGVRTLSGGQRTELYGVLDAFISSAEFGFDNLKNDGNRLEIEGTTEAKYGWVAANYSQGYAVSDYRAYVEMGGASAQIAIPVPLYHEAAALAAEKEKAAQVVQAIGDEEERNRIRASEEEGDQVRKWEVCAAEAYVKALGDATQVNLAKERADDINKDTGEHKRVARVDSLAGGRNVFLVSFPMGVDDGYKKYTEMLVATQVSYVYRHPKRE